jgi:hypothetical protein
MAKDLVKQREQWLKQDRQLKWKRWIVVAAGGVLIAAAVADWMCMSRLAEQQGMSRADLWEVVGWDLSLPRDLTTITRGELLIMRRFGSLVMKAVLVLWFLLVWFGSSHIHKREGRLWRRVDELERELERLPAP